MAKADQSHVGRGGVGVRPPLPANDNLTGALRAPEVRHRTGHPTSNAPSRASALPSDAVAVIEQVSRSVTQSGRPRGGWRLRFLPRFRLFVDPLTGWTGGEDTLRQVELRFPTREAAIRYAKRYGIHFEVREPAPQRRQASGSQAFQSATAVPLCCWPSGPHALCCGDYPVLKKGEEQC